MTSHLAQQPYFTDADVEVGKGELKVKLTAGYYSSVGGT